MCPVNFAKKDTFTVLFNRYTRQIFFADFYRNNDNNEVGKERINKLERLIRQSERKMKINGISFARLSFPMTTSRIMPSNLSRITI